MTLLQFFCKTLFMAFVLSENVFFSILADDTHNLNKRQIGVLARTGALPQGKRSVEVLARNGELPRGRKDSPDEDTQDLLIEELERAESLSELRAGALADKIFQETDPERYETGKRSVSALARNGQLPQKKSSESLARFGYLVKPSPEAVHPPPDLFDPDDFLADGQPPVVPQFFDERSFRTFLLSPKRSLGSARNFFLDPGINLYKKKNVASLARDGGFASLRHPVIKSRKVDDGFEFFDVHDDDKKDLGASGIDKRGISENSCDKYQMLKSVDRSDEKQRKRQRFMADSDYEDLLPEVGDKGNSLEKRFLGRIPQLGRIHQKVQAPSARRRPHLRPNWL